MDCSNTAKCMDRGDMEGQVECADKCVEEFREREEMVERERRRKEEVRQKQALLSVQSSGKLLVSCWRTMAVMIALMMMMRYKVTIL